jgi:predicted DNA-binding protein (MmcQ/YjbR family)
LAGQSPMKRTEAELLRFALSYPEAYEDHPWGETVVKVKKKVFAFLGVPGDTLHVSVKLPESASMALGLPFVAPTGYGLGKSGWVTATFGPKERPPVDVLKRWIDESYRAIAPKKLLEGREGAPKPGAAKAKRVSQPASRKKSPRRRTTR